MTTSPAAAEPERYRTAGGIQVRVDVEEVGVAGAIEPLVDELDAARGMLLGSGFEYPGRYSRWDVGFVDPPVALVGRSRELEVVALNERGTVLLPALAGALAAADGVGCVDAAPGRLRATVAAGATGFAEEDRSRQPSLLAAVRAIIGLLASPRDAHLGLYGAFGYDLGHQFEPIRPRLARPAGQRDVVLYLPDELVVVDRCGERAQRRRYEFDLPSGTTRDLPRVGERAPYRPAPAAPPGRDWPAGAYAGLVRLAKGFFRRGELFEVVLSQTFTEPCAVPPSVLYRRLRADNPSPYGFLANLGDGEYLVGASPEMYVRVEGRRVESCPISGTIARGGDAIADAEQIRRLLNSAKDEIELTMCTDVDRNDKARVCTPGSVRVVGRRQVELYSRLIHTVDHVEGTLRDGADAIDAFLAHAWAVTVTGAPKPRAMQFIEDHERTPRAWYGGAVGRIGFDGHLNTGLTLRTIRLRSGVAEVRAGATLLYDSDPAAEERETELKAAALLDAIRRPLGVPGERVDERVVASPGTPFAVSTRVLVVDHEDSFVHSLNDYLRRTGAAVTTLRAGFALERLDALRPDLVVLSAGPGRPADFGMSDVVAELVRRGVGVFGVCLGLQGIVEHFGGELGLLPQPIHGRPSEVRALGGRLLGGLPRRFAAGRYHSLYARRVPDCLTVTAVDAEDVVMAVEHREVPVAGVQFHPESILTGDVGVRLVGNAVRCLAGIDRARNGAAGPAPSCGGFRR